MRKRNLKEQHKNLEFHLVDFINKFDPTDTGKYTTFLTKMVQDRLEEESKYRHNENRLIPIEEYESRFKFPRGNNHLENLIFGYLIDSLGKENVEVLYSFEKHTKENRILNKDISAYSNWEQIRKEVSLADLKQNQKLLEKEVQKVVDNDEWLVIRPLTFESSLTYGAGTKWCTASRQNKDYFYRYSRNGVLCYAISKIDGEKFGLYYDIENTEFSIWNAPDRRIDSVESTIPSKMMSELYIFMKSEQCNYEYFSKSEKKKCTRYYKDLVDVDVVVTQEEPDVQQYEVREEIPVNEVAVRGHMIERAYDDLEKAPIPLEMDDLVNYNPIPDVNA